LDGKVALVTGGAQGIGKEIAFALGRKGAKVMVSDVREAEAQAATAELASTGIEAAYVVTDVADRVSVEGAVGYVRERFGRLDVAVNNAGIRALGNVDELDEDAWDRVIAVNLTGVFLAMKHELPLLLESQGCIVNMASIWGVSGWPGRSAYVASKHGVVGLTKAAAHEYGDRGVRVNAIAPGPIATDGALGTVNQPTGRDSVVHLTERIALKHFGQPSDIAGAVTWLADAPFVTGACVAVDGGWTAS
jgi:NAD(P)-dependent dehydrogenase (short-subunit alcohol dehydrogenase family)